MEKQPPKHIAIIMDGNGRWARSRYLPRLEGHQAGAKSVRESVEACIRSGVQYLTLFSFSTENWRRSPDEVKGLMSLFARYLSSEIEELKKNGIRLRGIGDRERLPHEVRLALERVERETASCERLNLNLAVSYGGREEILAATKLLARKVEDGRIRANEIDEGLFRSSLWSGDIPDPDLLIRTSGENRISNFLLWQLAYTEIVITDVLWPDFNQATFSDCLEQYYSRERRFGLTREQLKQEKESNSSLEHAC